MIIQKKFKTIAALLTIIVTILASGTYVQASVPEYRHNLCACTQDENYFWIQCCGSTKMEKGGELSFSYRRSPGLAGLPVMWKVSDGNIAGIDNGHLTAYGAGTVRVTAICGSYSSYCWITIEG